MRTPTSQLVKDAAAANSLSISQVKVSAVCTAIWKIKNTTIAYILSEKALVLIAFSRSTNEEAISNSA